jgi:Zn-dependent protease
MIDGLIILPIVIVSVIVHEIAHGWMAMRLGDTTAKDLGRLTLNPIPHIDLIGSIVVPLLSLAASGHVFIAWAKPVPVNPFNFRNPRRDSVLVSIVGPASNIVLAFICTLVVVVAAVLARAADGSASPLAGDILEFVVRMFYGGMAVNVALAVFNMLPIPPLDGSHVLAAALPPEAARQYMRVGFLGVILLLFLMRVPGVGNALSWLILTAAFPFRALVAMFL